jgi:hypothetical protein
MSEKKKKKKKKKMSVRELVLEAFKDKETGLTKNPSLLRKKILNFTESMMQQ